VLKGLGVKGVVTNGAMRDFGMLADNFQILAASISPSHGFAQIITIGEPVTIQGLDIADGDLIHADRHGAVIIPAAALIALPGAIDLVMRKERPLIDASKRAGFSVADLRLAMAEADDIH
jgi:regulator of RNase E activity RraA